MNKKTLEALKKSIAKWGKIAKSTKEMDLGRINCALCDLFGDDACEGCPVYKKTKKKYCRDTPYTEWSGHASKHEINDNYHGAGLRREPGCKECLILVKKELEFLKSLLPKGGKK